MSRKLPVRPKKSDFELTHVELYSAFFGCDTNGFDIAWETKRAGFGHVCFTMTKDGLVCENEMMSRAFIKRVLCKLVDDAKLVDAEPRKKAKPKARAKANKCVGCGFTIAKGEKYCGECTCEEDCY